MDKQKALLTDEEENKCTPTKEEIKEYLAEPDDAVAKALTAQEKQLVAKAILYGKKIAKAQLDKAIKVLEPEIRADERRQTLTELRDKWAFELSGGCPVMSLRLDDWIKFAIDAGIKDDWWELAEALKKGERPE